MLKFNKYAKTLINIMFIIIISNTIISDNKWYNNKWYNKIFFKFINKIIFKNRN